MRDGKIASARLMRSRSPVITASLYGAEEPNSLPRSRRTRGTRPARLKTGAAGRHRVRMPVSSLQMSRGTGTHQSGGQQGRKQSSSNTHGRDSPNECADRCRRRPSPSTPAGRGRRHRTGPTAGGPPDRRADGDRGRDLVIRRRRWPPQSQPGQQHPTVTVGSNFIHESTSGSLSRRTAR